MIMQAINARTKYMTPYEDLCAKIGIKDGDN